MAVDFPRYWGGIALNLQNIDIDEYLDFTAPLGKCSGVVFSLLFELPRMGFDRWKIEESLEVSPVFQQYWQLTLKQKQEMEAMIKTGLTSIATALSDLELLKHDLRRYKEFMDYYRMLDEGKKKGDKALWKKGDQLLRSIFIDQVDVHTGEGVSLRSIAPRWPTIIADFMRLEDEDVDPKKIAEKYDISEAEGVVLATKNKLYLEWRDNLFRKAVEDRFENLVRMVEARKKSFEEYKNMLRPTLARYYSIKEGITTSLKALHTASWWMPGTHAMAIEYVLIYAWKPIAPWEKYKMPRERKKDEVSLKEAGFTEEEIEELNEEGVDVDKTITALPVEPSIDDVVRECKAKIEEEYKVKLTWKDVLDARNKLANAFKEYSMAVGSTEPWYPSAYFAFLKFPIFRFVLRLPNGAELENLMINRGQAFLKTQNIMIGHYLELIAKDKKLDNYIAEMLGERGVGGKDISKVMEELFSPPKRKKEEKKKKWSKKTEFVNIPLSFIKARGPYEFAFSDRITKYYLKQSAVAFKTVVAFLKSKFGVP